MNIIKKIALSTVMVAVIAVAVPFDSSAQMASLSDVISKKAALVKRINERRIMSLRNNIDELNLSQLIRSLSVNTTGSTKTTITDLYDKLRAKYEEAGHYSEEEMPRRVCGTVDVLGEPINEECVQKLTEKGFAGEDYLKETLNSWKVKNVNEMSLEQLLQAYFDELQQQIIAYYEELADYQEKAYGQKLCADSNENYPVCLDPFAPVEGEDILPLTKLCKNGLWDAGVEDCRNATIRGELCQKVSQTYCYNYTE